ncbi:MAG: DNA polymerase III subunit delta [Oscillospiraceae bacterium]|nr:DNA polymerase III subunit delta [Oscillospiraceae bacterium]
MAYARKKQQNDDSYQRLTETLKTGQPDRLYFFHGEEPYLMERSLEQLRRLLIPEGAGAFNHHRLEGRNVTPAVLADTVDLLPVFSERTLIEIRDYDLFKAPEADRSLLQQLLTDLPDYVCVVFIFDTIPYSPDARQKTTKALLSCGQAVDFPLQESGRLVRWIMRHASEEGKNISRPDAEYLSFLTGGQMTNLNTEIAKLCSYCPGPVITREAIDVCVTPTVEAQSYRLADAVIGGDRRQAVTLLSDILQLQVPVQLVLSALGGTIRNVLYARLALDAGKNAAWLESEFHIARSFQASRAMESARRLSTERCRNMVLLCSEAALRANSGADGVLTDLLTDLCFDRKADLL